MAPYSNRRRGQPRYRGRQNSRRVRIYFRRRIRWSSGLCERLVTPQWIMDPAFRAEAQPQNELEQHIEFQLCLAVVRVRIGLAREILLKARKLPIAMPYLLSLVEASARMGTLPMTLTLLHFMENQVAAASNAFFVACRTGQLQYLRELLKQCSFVDVSASMTSTTVWSDGPDAALRAASANGYAEIVELLLQTGRVHPSTNRFEAVQKASAAGHEAVVKLLLEADANGAPAALEMAAQAGQMGILEMVLTRKDVVVEASVLTVAVSYGHRDVLKRLLQEMEPQRLQNSIENRRLKVAAVAHDQAHMLRFLHRRFPSTSTDDAVLLLETAALHCRVSILTNMLRSGSFRSCHIRRAFLEAVGHGHVVAARLLYSTGRMKLHLDRTNPVLSDVLLSLDLKMATELIWIHSEETNWRTPELPLAPSQRCCLNRDAMLNRSLRILRRQRYLALYSAIVMHGRLPTMSIEIGTDLRFRILEMAHGHRLSGMNTFEKMKGVKAVLHRAARSRGIQNAAENHQTNASGHRKGSISASALRSWSMCRRHDYDQ